MARELTEEEYAAWDARDSYLRNRYSWMDQLYGGVVSGSAGVYADAASLVEVWKPEQSEDVLDEKFLEGDHRGEEVNFYNGEVLEQEHCAYWQPGEGWWYTNPDIQSGTSFTVSPKRLLGIIDEQIAAGKTCKIEQAK